ncbi:hypothetical protein PsorP6_014021 [Peronosclerospora sorghi]|uniref:Uncharacterized protein n=1 Tax=Peronosclerospora sorghi TaxID=230839 RepID=A0ACC0VG91_9STRA|nr:hypothetical protein PsorP6_014021 [Peronosclerospora sorghi]
MAVERAGEICFPNWHRCLSHPDAKRLFDKLWTAASTTSPLADLYRNEQRLSRMLRRVFDISDAYVSSTAHSRSSSASTGGGLESFAPSRDKNLTHLILREVVFQLQHGMRLHSTDTVGYIGDPMLIPICSYEVVWLVRLSFKLSTSNEKFGFSNPYYGK